MAVTEGEVLVLRALGLGDLLTAVPALRGLRRNYPRHRLVLAAPEQLGELLPLLPEVDQLAPTPDLAAFSWPRPAPDVAVNLHGSGPQSVAAVCGTGARTVLSHQHPGVPGPPWNPDMHEVHRWCRMLAYWGIRTNPADLLLPEPDEELWPGSVVVHPGASHAARRWPAERFARVARCLADRGRHVVVTGSAAERPIAGRVAELGGLPPDSVLAGRTGLRQLAGLVSRAELVVCGDTGVAHLATAFDTPSVVLFGPVPPKHWGPPENPRHVALWRGRCGDTFADQPDAGLLELSAGDVLRAAEDLLSGSRS
ncbi:glycosyl transferase [Saccharopolyspora subtropica]|uniref:Glycosyl transferase n=1 Tax=Saccharopolyspora thermophila TaxID=89367 RepID=A0A917JYU7_9PSEU|nr:glycosyltransferase family 9 protein [Saccharopolyspora subtropica]GGI89485.1 glycosyl transferase [Saccharopolyspora subtropica]